MLGAAAKRWHVCNAISGASKAADTHDLTHQVSMNFSLAALALPPAYITDRTVVESAMHPLRPVSSGQELLTLFGMLSTEDRTDCVYHPLAW